MADVLTQQLNNRRAMPPIHLKYFDDLTIAEAVNLKQSLKYMPDRDWQWPLINRNRSEHILPPENSTINNQLVKISKYSKDNGMQINKPKSKVMSFNSLNRKVDFNPEFELDGEPLEIVDQMKILGVIIKSDLTWTENTRYICSRAYAKMWMIRRLKNLGCNDQELLDVYYKQIRSILEFAVPVWTGAITEKEDNQIERVQRVICSILLGPRYKSYSTALRVLNMESLSNRRIRLVTNFAKNSSIHPKHKHWFKKNIYNGPNTRSEKLKYCKVKSLKMNLRAGPIAHMTDLLNTVKSGKRKL